VGSCTTIYATGTYQNIVCGTANASGTATLTTDDGNLYFSFVFRVQAASVGVMEVTQAASDDGDADGLGIGVVVLSNINNGQPAECTGDTTGFDLNGVVAATVLEGQE
jgi:hypothetical protein